MGKKKKKAPKVWCYYCEREFDDEKILVQHQKAKHFKCHFCHKKLSTASGLVIHVLQLHKETVTKVPNAKPGRDATDREIFGMEGIPPEILAAHDGEDDYENPSKLTKTEIPTSGLGSMAMGSMSFGMNPRPLYNLARPMFLPPPSVVRPPIWAQQAPIPRPWPGASLMPGQPPIPPPPSLPSQPLFPIQRARPPPNAYNTSTASSQPPSQTLFPIQPPMPPVHAPPQPLFPFNGPTTVSQPALSMPYPTSVPRPPLETKPFNDDGLPPGSAPLHVSSPNLPLMSTMKPQNSSASGGSHMYASGPDTGGPSIGPPPVISKRVHGQGTTNQVYLVWDDEAMSMEERRLSLPGFQVHDVASQMNSVDAAIDKRISESRLAGQISFGV